MAGLSAELSLNSVRPASRRAETEKAEIKQRERCRICASHHALFHRQRGDLRYFRLAALNHSSISESRSCFSSAVAFTNRTRSIRSQ